MNFNWIICLLCILGLSVSSSSQLSVPEQDQQETVDTAVHEQYYLLGNTTASPNVSDNATYPSYVGFITAGVAVIFYGSNFVPVKKFETGDGMFFQWVLCAGIWLTGLILQIVRQSRFHPIVMIGGVIWATGNVCVVPIIKTIGMGLGLCIWGMFNLLSGWASGRFGWFGIDSEVPGNPTLNYVGVALAVSSSVIYMFVKNDVGPANVELVVQVDEKEPLIHHDEHLYGGSPEEDPLIFNRQRTGSTNSSQPAQDLSGDRSFIENLSPGYKKIVGVGLSVFSGVLYGVNFAPAISLMDRHKHDPDYSQNSLDYVFSQYCGIFLAGSFYFFVYIILKKNKPQVYPRVILPGIASGMMWAIATGCWFIANKALSEPVAFPIITTGPGALASLFWGVCVFKEIKGRRNILILLLAFVVTASGAILAGVSKA